MKTALMTALVAVGMLVATGCATTVGDSCCKGACPNPKACAKCCKTADGCAKCCKDAAGCARCCK